MSTSIPRRSAFLRRTLAGLAAGAALIAVAAPAHAGETWNWRMTGYHGVTGSGRMAAENRSVGSFQAVAVRGSFRVVVRQSAREAVEVRADDNLLPLIETRVVDRGGVPTLEIATRDDASYSTRNDPVVTVDVVNLSAIAVAGSGDVSADGLSGSALKLSVSGSGDLKLERVAMAEVKLTLSGSGDVVLGGSAQRMTVSIAGSGDVDAGRLEADDVTVDIAGSGDAQVNARKALKVAIAGSGDVSYTGAAAVRSSIAGSGTVSRR